MIVILDINFKPNEILIGILDLLIIPVIFTALIILLVIQFFNKKSITLIIFQIILSCFILSFYTYLYFWFMEYEDNIKDLNLKVPIFYFIISSLIFVYNVFKINNSLQKRKEKSFN